jgi:hypothetical protein
VAPRSQVLFIGGRSGVGKSTVGAELYAQLCSAEVSHCMIEGDNLDLAYPVPREQALRLAELNLAAMWANYRAAGHSRLVYVNAASVRGPVLHALLMALGDDPVAHGVLLTASDEVAEARLAQREIGGGLAWHVERSRQVARELEEAAPGWVWRIETDGKSVVDVATTIVGLLNWRPDVRET